MQAVAVILVSLVVGGSAPTADRPGPQRVYLYGPDDATPVLTAWFFSRRCPACDRARGSIDGAADAAGVRVRLEYFALEEGDNAARLLVLEERAGDQGNAIPVLLVGDRVLGGPREIERHITDILFRYKRDPTSCVPLSDRYAETPPETGEEVARDRLRKWGLGAVIAGGLIDGINPCAFTAVALLLSWLTVMGRSRSHLLVIGAVFCLTVFACYLALGIVLGEAFQGLRWLGAVGAVVRWLVIAATLGFAVACAYDTVLAARSRGGQMILKLPKAVQERVRRTIRGYAKTGSLVASTVVLAAAIALLETACTGQLYLPTISYLVRTGGGWDVIGLLVVYNAAFVAPLVVVFLAVAFGVSSQRFAALYQRAVPVVKGAMCLVFLGMTALLVMLEVPSLTP